MTIEYREGDLFAQPDLQALSHGVNCHGKMGAGIAVEFRKRFPAMHEKYVNHCKAGRLKLGMVFPWHEQEDFWVYNMASQDKPGRNASLAAVDATLAKVIDHMEKNGVKSLGLPLIGCGIGGLSWPQVRAIFEKHAASTDRHLVVVQLP